MEKGQKINIKIEDISAEGQGIGRADGMAVFVPGVVLGDTVSAELTKVKKTYAFARLLEVTEPSSYRCEPICACGNCGGCSLGETSYEAQLMLKEKQLKDKLTRLAGLTEPYIEPIIGMEIPYNYRNKAQMPVSTGGIITRKGGIIENLGEPAVGFFEGHSHTVVNCEECRLQLPTAMAAARALRQFMREDNITAWDPKWEKGLLRHLIVKTAVRTGEVMVVLVINGKGIPNAQKLVEMLEDAIYELPPAENGVYYSLESVVLNINKKAGSGILGEECVTLAGKPSITEELCGLSFEISPLAFYQVNPVQTEKLYAKVLEYAALSGMETVFDLYCGVGTIGLICAREMERLTLERYGQADYEKMGRVLGIESVRGAVIDANRNAVINHIVNAEYICGRAEDEIGRVLSGYTDKDGFAVPPKKPDVVILDPPRAGCAVSLLEAVSAAGPEKIVYVSCDPATLARDIKLLCGMGYGFEKAAPVDMFPHTGALETVCLLVRRNGLHIDIDVDVEEMLQEKRGQATYAQIKDYVLEQNGLKVSSLYISQVKRKCGLDVGENYNKPKSEDSKQPQCPPEKEEAIKEALQHFGMI